MIHELSLPVLKVRQPIGDFFVASIPAKDLVDITFSDVRRLVKDQRDLEKYLGIQRPVSPKRIKDIKQYIEGVDATFPTAVILAIDEKCAEFEESSGNFGTLVLRAYTAQFDCEESIPYERIAKVIDGQHRIAAFIDSDRNWTFDLSGRDFDINVSIFVGADVSEQANIFATVNLAQTKVNKSLVYDLTELAEVPSPHKTCHNVAVALDREQSSPLYKRIKRLGTATPGRSKEPLTQAGFVESLVRFISDDPVQDRNLLLEGKKLPTPNQDELKRLPFRRLFIEGREIDITEIVYNYFSAIQKKWPESWSGVDRVGNLLPKSNAFKAFMVYLREDLYPKLSSGIDGYIPSEDEFLSALSHVVAKDSDFTTRNFAPGSGGQSAFLKMLRSQITLEDMLKPD